MTFDAKETSRHEGSPVELYRWTQGSTVWLNTSADTEQTDGSEIYEPTVISRNEIRQSQEDHSGNIEVRVPRDHPVAALFIPYVPTTPVGLRILRQHRLDIDEEFVVGFVGKVLSAKYDSEESQWMLTCAPVSEAFRRTIPIVLYQPQCNLALYSDACGVDKLAFKVTATVTAIDGFTITSATFAGFADGYFNNGWAQRQSDPNDIRWVVDHAGNVLTLMNPFSDLSVSDSVEVFPGCQRTEADCHNKFANLPNHLGFSRIPTKNPFETSVEY